MKLFKQNHFSVSVRILVITAAFLLCGCQTASFYKQAIVGQCHILTHQESIESLIASSNTPPQLKEKLKLVLEIRQFANGELQLPIDGHYLKYVDLHRPFVVWDVYAAPELSLEPKTWWFPIVGRASYRGYFSEKGARQYASGLKEKGYDVYVGGVETYSTLGWFRDPLLNTFIYESETDLAEIIFHELGHQELFISGDTDFNEAFATAVAEEGLRRWFGAKQQPEAFKQFKAELAQRAQFTQLVLDTIKELESVYNAPSLSDSVKRERKIDIIQKMRASHGKLKASWNGQSLYDAWFSNPINNAKLSTVATYYEWVPAFEAILKANGGDMKKFYEAVRRIGRLPDEKRHSALRAALANANPR